MKTFYAFAVVAVGLSAPLQIWSAPAWAGATSDQSDQAGKASHAKATHDYWLGNGLNRLALLLPSHKGGETVRR